MVFFFLPFLCLSGVHHKKKNCESNQVISKVQKVLYIARRSKQLFPRNLVKIGTFSVASLKKRSKLRKGNGGWGDHRDQQLCLNMSIDTRWKLFISNNSLKTNWNLENYK